VISKFDRFPSVNGNRISVTARISDEVVLGNGNVICEEVVISGNVTIGDNNYFGPGVKVGGFSRQRLRAETNIVFISDAAPIEIGSNNLIFENCVIHAPIQSITLIRDNVSVGAGSHIAHDCEIRDGATLSVGIGLGGYVIVGTCANLGIGVSVHPRLAVGAYSMCGMSAVVIDHVKPGETVAGVPAKFLHVNERGFERNNVSAELANGLRCFLNDGDLVNNCQELKQLIEEFSNDKSRWARS